MLPVVSTMQTIATDVLIIGAGAAGIRAALAACEAGVDVLMVAKGAVTESGSTFSTISKGWGIKTPLGEERAEKNLETSYDDIVWVGAPKARSRRSRQSSKAFLGVALDLTRVTLYGIMLISIMPIGIIRVGEYETKSILCW